MEWCSESISIFAGDRVMVTQKDPLTGWWFCERLPKQVKDTPPMKQDAHQAGWIPAICFLSS